MIDIPSDVRIKSTIKPGSVFYFSEEKLTSQEPHFYIVLNHDPMEEKVLLLVISSSQVEKVERRRKRFPKTLVKIKKEEYSDFTENESIIDCNDIFPKSIDQLIRKLEKNELRLKSYMDISIVERLRAAVQESPLVSKEFKELLKKAAS